MTARALIGHTGFVGGNLLEQAAFDDLYNSGNIEAIAGREYDLVVCAGAPAVKWKANREPEADWRNLRRLMDALARVETRHLVLISTVDVYPVPVEVDEDSPIDRTSGEPYGRHRLLLEDYVRERFTTTVVRLPGLFGKGLKKNVIYDLANDNALHLVCPDSVFQFYNLDRLWRDIGIVRANGVRLANLATEGLSVKTIAKEAFGIDFVNPEQTRAVRYDFRTRYAALFGGGNGYIQRRDQVLKEIVDFAVALREKASG